MVHFKSEENRWKKSPIFGSVNGDETAHNPKEALQCQFYKSIA